jgi:hypothetical protein
MCDPVSATIATVVGTAASLYGTYQQTQAASANAKAVQAANMATADAQNQAFGQRMAAGLQRTAAETAASNETMAARDQAATTMRGQQMSALQRYQQNLDDQNRTAESLRQTGDTAAQQLLQQTGPQQLADAETQRRQQAAELLQGGVPEGPGPTDPSGTNAVGRDTVAGGALARRTAEAATNIRDYGSKIGQLSGYAAPGQEVGLAIAGNKYGIMPAQTAEKLLQGGSAARLLPTQIAYQSATGLGTARDILEQSRGQGAFDAAGLSYGNATDIANLQQSNANTIAKNTLGQKQADLEADTASARMISGIGQLGLYGAGYYGGDSLSKTYGSLAGIFAPSSNAAMQSYGVFPGPNNPYTSYSGIK